MLSSNRRYYEARVKTNFDHGFTPEKELTYRQQATRFIQIMVDQLNHNVRDQRGKISQLCMCAAIMHMHRFFCFHSFKFFDYRDVAAACLFLAGKSEECPRKLDHIVRVWWSKKFERHPAIPSNNVSFIILLDFNTDVCLVKLQKAYSDSVNPPLLFLPSSLNVARRNKRKWEVFFVRGLIVFDRIYTLLQSNCGGTYDIW
ncbi:unnamed protein product [Haemonchus placei]|uniref:Cyclin N-terminal domain-containing protein n=1 Tax=Haemonchus placei TaxID=6290 RepID=A0A0N4X9I9_HAEPC|nr:unnamed protein product [Haemonchus placei]